MWTRWELKERAKNSLRGSYWKAFLLSLLLALVTGGVPSCTWRMGNGESGGVSSSLPSGGLDSGLLAVFIVIAVLIAIVVIIFSFAFRAFLASPLTVGVRQYFKQAALGEVNINHLGYAFSNGNYWSVVKGMLWKDILNFLWYLLLVVPGIVKSYSYGLVPYLLADNPRIGTKRAVELSRGMMRGHKWNTFVLDLSFLGWFLLGALALGVGTFFVLPYYNATRAELYVTLRERAVEDGICSREELRLI